MFAWLGYLVISGQPQFSLTVFGPTLTIQALNTALIAGYAFYLFRRRQLPGPTPLDFPVAALLVVYAAAIATSIYPRVSLEASLGVFMAFVAFYAFHDFDFLRRDVMVRGLAAIGAIAAAYALLDVAENYLDWLGLVRAVEGGLSFGSVLPPAVPRVTGVGDNVNVLAMALNLSLPFAFAVALAPARRFERPAGIVAAVVILAALFFTLSRGAWLGTAAAIAVFSALYLVRDVERGFAARLRERVPPKALLAAVVALLVLGVIALAGISAWDSRPEWLFRASLGPRYDAAQVGFEIVRDRPWLGSGPYTYPLLYSVYSGDYPVENIHPHNGYVNVLVDLGIIGGLVLLAAGAILASRLYRRFVAPVEAPESRIIIIACIASLASLAIHSLADSPNVWTTALMPLAAVLALSLRDAAPLLPRAPRAVVLAPRLMMAVLPVVILGLWVRFDLPHADFDASVKALSTGRFEAATVAARDAADADSDNAAYHINEGLNLVILHLVTAESGRTPNPGLLSDAAGAFYRAIELEPRSPIAHANLAMTLAMLGNAGSAVTEARIAIARAPTDGAITAAAASVLEWAQLTDDAASAYGTSIWRDPALAQSPFWAENDRAALRGLAISTSGLQSCEIGRVGALFAGFDDDLGRLSRECRQLVDDRPGDARARADLAVILAALGRDEEALTEAQRAVGQVPDSPFIRTSLAVALTGTGDLSRVRHELVIAAHLGDPDAALLLTYTYAPPSSNTPVVRRIKEVTEPGPLPDAVRKRLEAALPASSPVVFDSGIQYYTLGVLYYRVRFMRESPTSILVPGDWLNLASPRTLLIAEALKDTSP